LAFALQTKGFCCHALFQAVASLRPRCRPGADQKERTQPDAHRLTHQTWDCLAS
jgi:hypothetical protein